MTGDAQKPEITPTPRERPHSLPTNAAQFEEYMIALDQYFARIKLPIAARSLAAMVEVGIDQGRATVHTPKMLTPAPGKFDGDDLLLHAEQWFTQRYPAHAHVDMSLGSTVVVLHGQVWPYRVPIGGGHYILHAGNEQTGPATVATPKGYPLLPPNHPIHKALPGFNLLGGVIDLPTHVADALTDDERYRVVRAYCRGQLAFFWLLRARKHKFIRGALGDFAASVQHILSAPPQPGLSRWQSLQAVEKVFKSYLHHAGVSFPTRGRDGHDLKALARLVEQNGGPAISDTALALIQCSASIRYDTRGETADSAIDAHYAALDTVHELATLLCNEFPLADTPRMNDRIGAARDIVHLMAERIGLHGTGSE